MEKRLVRTRGLIFGFILTLGLFLGIDNVQAATITATLEMSGTTGLTEITSANPLSPDDDDTKDFVEVNCSVDAEGELRIVVDTDRDGNYEPITDWSVINWQDPTNANYAGNYDYTMSMYTWTDLTQYF